MHLQLEFPLGTTVRTRHPTQNTLTDGTVVVRAFRTWQRAVEATSAEHVRAALLTIDPATVPSAVLRRLIAEVQREPAAAGVKRVYDRIHNRHNRSMSAQNLAVATSLPRMPQEDARDV